MKKKIKYLLIAILSIFLLLNIFIAIHSYSFTHYDEKAEPIAFTSVEDIPISQMLKAAFCGVRLPKPKADIFPDKYTSFNIPLNNDIQLAGWHLKTDSTKLGSVLLFHGFGDQKSAMLPEAYQMLRMGYDTYLIDFVGAGESSGNQVTIGYYEGQNVIQSYEYLYPQIKDGKIFLSGFSMGAVAIMKAMHDKPMQVDGLILSAPFSTLENTIGSRAKLLGAPEQPAASLFTFWIGALNGFNAFSFKPIEDGKSIDVPTLLMCGKDDQYISNKEISNIYNAIKATDKELILFDDCTHERYLLKHRDKWVNIVSEFVNNKRTK